MYLQSSSCIFLGNVLELDRAVLVHCHGRGKFPHGVHGDGEGEDLVKVHA